MNEDRGKYSPGRLFVLDLGDSARVSVRGFEMDIQTEATLKYLRYLCERIENGEIECRELELRKDIAALPEDFQFDPITGAPLSRSGTVEFAQWKEHYTTGDFYMKLTLYQKSLDQRRAKD